ncbi:MAG: site-2 protease family protein [Chloroflexi bacterium]|nr:site-2 protease family protein [Chloroflexota bacterium]
MSRPLKVFTLFGTPVRISYTWPIAPVIITIALGTWVSNRYSPTGEILVPYTFAAMVALCLAVSVLIHEFAHVLVARRLGIRSTGITLFALGGVSRLDDDDHGRPRTDLAVSMAGPITSLILGLACGAIALLPDLLNDTSAVEIRYASLEEWPSMIVGPHLIYRAFEYLATANIIIGLFNLLPLFPLDGGRILSAILWAITNNRQQAVGIAALIGQLGAAAIITYGAYNLFFGELLPGIWLTAIGIFLMEAAVSASPRNEQEQPTPG